VVVTPDVPSLWRTTRLLQFLETLGAREKVRLILNRSHKANVISEKEIEQVLKFPIDWKLPNDYAAANQALNWGRTVVEVNHSVLATSYNQLACELSGAALPDKRRKRFSLF
jgi:Flp pilus assembly CpaE family ATPase